MKEAHSKRLLQTSVQIAETLVLHVLDEPGHVRRSPSGCQVEPWSCEESVLAKRTFGKAVITDGDVLERMLESPVIQVINGRRNEADGSAVRLVQQRDNRGPGGC